VRAFHGDDVRTLTDQVTADTPWRATAATRLAALVTREPALLTEPVLRRLDAVLPDLLRSARATDVRALVALCAALGDRLSPAVRAPLQALVRGGDARVAVAAHVACLLVEGLVPSAQHLDDLTAVADVDPRLLAAGRTAPPRERAAALAHALAVS
jgi:hypothetical protein